MAEYQQTQTISAPAGEVFALLSDVGNLPKYLPPVTDASIEGPSAEGAPGQRLRATLEYPNGGSFDSEGYFNVDEGATPGVGRGGPAGLLGLAHRCRGGQRQERGDGAPVIRATLG